MQALLLPVKNILFYDNMIPNIQIHRMRLFHLKYCEGELMAIKEHSVKRVAVVLERNDAMTVR